MVPSTAGFRLTVARMAAAIRPSPTVQHGWFVNRRRPTCLLRSAAPLFESRLVPLFQQCAAVS